MRIPYHGSATVLALLLIISELQYLHIMTKVLNRYRANDLLQ